MATILNVAPNTTIGSAWGNSVADEVNLRCLKTSGGTLTGDLTLRNANPTADNHAARKKYVDDRLTQQVTITGDAMTGTLTINPTTSSQALVLRSQATAGGGSYANTPYLSFYNNSATTRFGYVQGTSAYLNIVSDTGDIQLNSGGGQVRTSDALYANGGLRGFQASGICSTLIGTGSRAYMQFYSDGTNIDTGGVRSGYIGYPTSNNLNIINEVGSASIVYATDFAHAFQCGATPAEVARIQPNVMLVGKTTSGLTATGVELFEQGTIYSTHVAGGAAPVVANRQNSVDGEYMFQVCRNGTTIGRIEQEGTTGSKFVSGSDRRMKNILGPITDGIERVKAMKPWRVSYVGDPSRGECDAFIADEMQPIVPEAVSGQPNAVAGPPVNETDPPEGTPLYQGMSYEKVITVTVAALQNLIGRVEALEGV